MLTFQGQDDLTVFLAELHGFFETCGPEVDAALARHFGEDTAIDWIVVNIELFIEALADRPFTPPTSAPPGDST